jgi:hypothetical protein
MTLTTKHTQPAPTPNGRWERCAFSVVGTELCLASDNYALAIPERRCFGG